MTKKSNSLYSKEQKSFLDYFQFLVLLLIFTSMGLLEFKSLWFSGDTHLEETPITVAQVTLDTPTVVEVKSTSTTQAPTPEATPIEKPVVVVTAAPVVEHVAVVEVLPETPQELIPLIKQAQTLGNEAFIDHVKAHKTAILPQERAELMADIIESKNSVLLYGLAYVKDFWTIQEQEQLLRYFMTTGQVNATESLIKYGYTTSLDYTQVKELIHARLYRLAMLAIENNFISYDARDERGFTLLHEASSRGHEELMRQLVAKGLSVNVVASNDVSVLHYPVHLGFKNTVSILLELGIDPNISATANYTGVKWAQSTPLHIASERGWSEIVTLLLANGANAALLDAKGRTPAEVAKSAEVAALFEKIE